MGANHGLGESASGSGTTRRAPRVEGSVSCLFFFFLFFLPLYFRITVYRSVLVAGWLLVRYRVRVRVYHAVRAKRTIDEEQNQKIEHKGEKRMKRIRQNSV